MENYATKKPDDYVIATGSTYTVKQFIEEVCRILKLGYSGKVREKMKKLTKLKGIKKIIN